MEKDRRERDEFSKRLLEKDKEKAQTKNKPVLKNPRGVTLTTEEKESMMPNLRMESRMKYLDKREQEKLEFAKKKLIDDQLLFGDDELTLK